MTAGVEISTGIINTFARDKSAHVYVRHPDSNLEIKGFQIPFWNEIKRTVTTVALLHPNMRYIGWDVAVTQNDEICLIEGNTNAGSDVFQVVAGRGLRKEYEEILGKW